MKNKVKSFSGENIEEIESKLKNFFEKNKNIKVTAMSMTFDSQSYWFYVLLTYYEEGE